MSDLPEIPTIPPEDEETLQLMDERVLEPANDEPGVLPPRIGDTLPGSIERMRRRVRGEEKPVPLPWPNVAEALGGGLWPGLTVVVGNTGSGKSQWCLQVALEAAGVGVPVLFIALELSSFALDARLLGLAAGTAWSPLYLGQDSAVLEAAVREHGDRVSNLPIHVVEAPAYGWDYENLLPQIRALVDVYRDQLAGRPPLVVLDFLQLVSGNEQDLRQRIQRTAYAAQHAAKSLNVACLLVSSTARHNYATLDYDGGSDRPWDSPPRRFVGVGKESGEVEYAADACLTLLSEPWGNEGPPRDGTRIHLAIAKLRHGPATWCDLRFDGSRFTEPPQETVTHRPARR